MMWVGLGRSEAVIPIGGDLRCAVVTPYLHESDPVLARCMASVRAQTVAATHVMVADGASRGIVARAPVRHVVLNHPHADYGGTPRAVGALLAIAEGFDVIALLDADNWFEPDHLARCLEAAFDGCDYVIARRRLMRPDGSMLIGETEPIAQHVDTSCLVLLRGAFHLLPVWGLIPRPAAPVGDRLFHRALLAAGLAPAVSPTVTVNYTTTWGAHFVRAGEAPPAGAKPSIDLGTVPRWLRGLSPRDGRIVERLLHLSLAELGMVARTTPGVAVVSFFMDNVGAEIVALQRAVVERFLPPDTAFQQISTHLSHAASLDLFMATTDCEVVVFLDIDCVPLHRHALPGLIAMARGGALAGCARRAGHVDNGGHVYAGPFCLAVPRALWLELGRPSFQPTTRGDVGEELTWVCEAAGRPLHLLYPSAVEIPQWELGRNVRFGINTAYAGAFLHGFAARWPEPRERFLRRCREILAAPGTAG